MHKMSNKLTQVKTRIQLATQSADRNPDKITLLAVSKKHPVEKIRELYALGQKDFGENYLQEALAKIAATNDLEKICWHFIGPIQSNKTRPIAEHFHWVHSVDRLKVAERLNNQRPANLPPLKICIQVNIDNEETKSGVSPENAPNLAEAIISMPRLHLKGLMCIPSSANTDAFKRMQILFEGIGQKLNISYWDCLSMGMSSDLESAISAGSTLVRIGTSLFGERAKV